MKLVFALGVPSDFKEHQTYIFGIDGGLPWPHHKQDMKNFKEETSATMVVMGSKTFESLPYRLPCRTNVVISRDHGDGARIKAKDGSLPDVLWSDPIMAYDYSGRRDIVVIGGLALLHQCSFFATEVVVSFVYMDKTTDEILDSAKHTTVTATRDYFEEMIEGMHMSELREWRKDNGDRDLRMERYKVGVK